MFSSLALADDDRHITVDREIGGMKQGSRIQAPGSFSGKPGSGTTPLSNVHQTVSSHQGSERRSVDSSASSTSENHGFVYTGETNHPIDTGTSELPVEPVNNPIDTGAGAGGTGTGKTSTESGGTGPGAGPTEGSSNPIVGGDVNVNPGSGRVEADATVDTSGELEDKQIFDADLGAQDVISVDAEVGGATESGSTTGGTQESSGTSTNPIVDAEVSADLESGKVEVDATVDTSGELEEKQILDADVTAAETAPTETEVGSATDVTQSDTVESTDITTQPVSTVTTTSDLTAEVDTTGGTTGSEADIGVEADASGTSEGEDVACDPTDGLTATDCEHLKL